MGISQKLIRYLIWCILVPINLSGQDISNLGNDTLHIPYNSAVTNGIIRGINKENKKYGFIDISGKTVIPFRYDYADNFEESVAIVELEDKFGIIDQNEIFVVPLEYSYIKNVKNGKCIAEKDGAYGVIDLKNSILVPFKYDKLISKENINFFFKLNETVGIRNYKKTYELSIPVQSVQVIRDKAYILESDGVYHLVDAKAKYLHADYQKLIFKGGLIIAKKNNKYGFISQSGKIIQPCIYDRINEFSEGLSAIRKNGVWGYADISGKVVIPFVFEKAGQFNNVRAIVKKSNKYGLIDSKGRFLIEPRYDYIAYNREDKLYFLESSNSFEILTDDLIKFSNYTFTGRLEGSHYYYKFKNGRMLVQMDDLYGYLDENGEFAIRPQFRCATEFKDGYAIIGRCEEKQGLIDDTGKIVLPKEYEDIETKFSNLILAKKNNLTSIFIGDSLIIDNIDGHIKDISKNHLLIQRSDGEMMMRNLKGESILPETYDQIEFQMFAPGIAIRKGDKWGYYDLELQKLVVPVEFNKVDAFHGGHSIVVVSKGKYGLLNKNGTIVLKPTYDKINAMTKGVLVILDGKYGLLDKKGNEILPVIYDSIEYLGNLKFKVVQNGEFQIVKYDSK